MSISFFRGLELVVGALMLVVVVAVGVLVWLWFSGLGKTASSAELAPVKIEEGDVTNVSGGVRVFLWICNLSGGAVLPRTAYVYKSVVCFADGLPWVVGPGRLDHLDVWMPSDVGGGWVWGGCCVWGGVCG